MLCATSVANHCQLSASSNKRSNPTTPSVFPSVGQICVPLTYWEEMQLLHA
jgi:hypothetical protein